ncbi:adhesion G-protein coupled receptor G7-like isoform X2 [Anguilla anguilla]|uniref:adhesion G-protein coupled receptor G7-like isoform X2 n=1 Tax=Anguilla anguilla TaxID=7936 RepID=UPI0015B26358|nr:adhesion G-protein coupled receptor G7-like isoform X2 [Anguilla anguilla]
MDTGLLFLALLLREVSVSETQGTLATPPAYSSLPAASLSNISTDPGSTTAGISGSTTHTDFLTTPTPDHTATSITTNLTTTVPTNQTTPIPTNQITTIPTNQTTPIPTNLTTPIPTNQATTVPTNQTTPIPTNLTTPIPTNQATTVPTTRPTTKPGTLTTTQPGSLTPSNPTGTSTTVKQTTTTKHTPNSTLIPAIFCNGAVVDGFTFNKTVIGRFSYSREPCPGPANVGFPLASVRCLNKTGFGPVRKLDCGLTLNDLLKNIAGNSVSVSTNVLMLTSQPTRLTPDNITTAAEIVTQLLKSTPTEEVAAAAVATVSQLLSANIPDVGTVNSSATNSLTSELASFSLQQKEGVSLLVQPNLVVQSVGGLGASRGVEFLTQTGLFVADRIHLNTSTSQLSNDNTSDLSVQILIQLHPDASRADESVGFVLYQNDLLFQSVKFKAPLGTTRQVISASLTNEGRLGLVELRFRPTNATGAVLHDFACVFWDYAANDWSTAGCRKNGRSSTSLGCVCDHATNFAVLMSFRNNYAYADALNWISFLGCSLSVAGASVTIIFQILTWRSRKANVTLLLVSICFSLLVFYLLFLLGINNHPPNSPPGVKEANVALPSDKHEERDSGICTAVAALLHYFLLATFAWNTLYATQIFLLVLRPLAQNDRPFTIAALVAGWGFPAAVVAVTLGATYTPQHPLNYRQEEFCWLAALDKEKRLDLRKPMLWGFLLPVALMLLYNCVIYVYFTVETCRTNPTLRSTRINSPVKKVLSSLSLSVVLGLSWVLGYLLLIDTASSNNVVGIIFCLLTTTQGLQIFFLFTARTSAFKKKLSELLQLIPVPEIALHHRKFIPSKDSRDNNYEKYSTMEELSSSQF